MTSLKQIKQDIEPLPPEALELVAQFVRLLKKTYSVSTNDTPEQAASPEDSSASVYERFQNSGLIGCLSAEENLSTTYKEVLAKEWSEKHDHR